MADETHWKAPAIKFDFNEHMALVVLIRHRRAEIKTELKKKLAEQRKHHLEYEEKFLQQCARKLELAGEVNGHLLEAERTTQMLSGGVLEEPELD